MKNMVGLVFIETLRLTPGQWTALAFNAAGWLWCFRSSRRWMLTAILTVSGLWMAFWNTTTSVDTWWFFDQAQELSPLTWLEFLEQVAHQLYVDKQPPFLTFWFSRVPVLWFHQLLWFPWAMLCAGLMWRLYGRAAALLLATPVFALMMHQPSNDVLLFGTLLIVLRLRKLSSGVSKRRVDIAAQRRHWPASGRRLKLRFSTPQEYRVCRFLAALIYGLTWMIKPLTILTAPFILPQLGIAGLLSLTIWGGYVVWSWQWEFGRDQFRFLLHQLMLTSMKQASKTGTTITHAPLMLSMTLHTFLKKIRNTLRWRWKHVGNKAITAFPFYLFPVWLRPWTWWQGIALAVVIILGYGQIKYLLLDLLFLFPVNDEEGVPSCARF